MTGLEAVWVPLVVGAVAGGGTAAAKGGSFGDIAKGAGLGAAGGAVTGGLASGLGALGGAAGGQMANTAADAITAPSTPGAIAPAPQPIIGQNIPDTSPNLMATLNQQATPGAIAPAPQPIVGQNISEQPQQPAADTKKGWTTADYINATSSAANLAANIAQSPETPRTPIAPMPAIFSGQGGDLMQQLSQLSQG